MLDRRIFLKASATLAFSGLASCSIIPLKKRALTKHSAGYGALMPDPKALLDLPKNFSYEVISQLSNVMSDGLHVPDRADGMGCIALSDNTVALIRNHELSPKNLPTQPKSFHDITAKFAYDTYSNGVALPGGTSTIIYDVKNKQVVKEYMSLIGTIRNCSGGITPWGTWLTCEESVAMPDSNISRDHGYVFEVPANAEGLVSAEPLKAMGRFNHEAACVDPNTGIVYMTEDRGDSLFYRFVPKVYGDLAKGGQLQAMSIKGMDKFDTRNWDVSRMTKGQWLETEWLNLDDPESPDDDLRIRGYQLGATLFARGEGIYWADNELYFTCTNGGKKHLGQVMRYQPSNQVIKAVEQTGKIQLFVESEDENELNYGDNLTVSPQGHLIVCEDQYTDVVDNHLRGVTSTGITYAFAKLNAQTEMAGACFSPDGSVLFINIYSPTMTLAITGPWDSVQG